MHKYMYKYIHICEFTYIYIYIYIHAHVCMCYCIMNRNEQLMLASQHWSIVLWDKFPAPGICCRQGASPEPTHNPSCLGWRIPSVNLR